MRGDNGATANGYIWETNERGPAEGVRRASAWAHLGSEVRAVT